MFCNPFGGILSLPVRAIEFKLVTFTNGDQSCNTFRQFRLGIPCEPPSDEAKAGEVKRALFEREARVAQRPVWPRSVGEVGEPGSPFLW